MKKRKRMLNLFYIPALILILFFVVYPLLEAFRISFTQWNGYSQDYKYIGFSNYAKLFKDENFRTAFINTIIYGFGSTLLQNVFGLAYAVFLNSRFRGHSVVRTFIYLPAMISGLIMGYIIYFFVMYNHGVFNEIIGWFGAAPVDWMADGPRGVIIMTLINSWQFVGICMVIYLAGLQSIPTELMEAATIDGASTFQKFRYITLPLLKNTHMFVMITCMINAFRSFDLVYTMTQGGPLNATKTIVMYVYEQAFNKNYYGRAAAGGIVLFVFMAALTIIRFKIEKED